MKILQVSSFMPPHPGGLELVVQNLFTGLQERNHDVRWIASSAPLPPGIDSDHIRVSAFTGLEGLVHVPLPFWGPSGYRHLYHQCKWADIIHIHDCLYPSSMMAAFFARILKKKSLVTQHISTVPYGRLLSLAQIAAYRSVGRWVLNSASSITAYSAHVPPFFASIGVRKPIYLIPLGFDERFNTGVMLAKNVLRKKYGIPTKSPVVLFVGRLVPKKGIADVVATQKQLAERGCTMVIVGDGALASMIKASPLTIHIPNVAYSDMHEMYGLADVLFLPSHGEGLPLTLQEGLLCGVPAVVSRDPSYVANVAGAPGVFLCESIDSYLASILKALRGEVSADTISAWAQAHFAKSLFLDEYEKLYCAIRS